MTRAKVNFSREQFVIHSMQSTNTINRELSTFYIAGCQRSGTTLVRLIMDSHPELFCFDEADGYRILIRLSHDEKRVKLKEHGKTITGFKIPRFTEQLLRTEMSDTDYGQFESFYAGEPVLFMVRSELDVVASMKSLTYPDGEGWICKFGKPILLHQAKRMEFKERYACDVETLESNNYEEHLVAALYWKYKTDVLFDYKSAKMPVLAVSYEKLVSEPRNVLSNIVSFLGVNWDDAMLSHHTISHSEIDATGKSIGNTNAKKPIDQSSIGKYKSILSSHEVDGILTITDSTSRTLKTIFETRETF